MEPLQSLVHAYEEEESYLEGEVEGCKDEIEKLLRKVIRHA